MNGLAMMKRILGIDFGRVRVGLAISDELGLLAHPVETVPADNSRQMIARIAEIVRDKEVARVIVGLPRKMDGSIGPAADEVLAFVEKLRAQLSCPVLMWDERLTTVAANRALSEAGQTTRKTRGHIDQVAAQLILQGYLDQLQLQAEERRLAP